jgi:hypothetical protein
VWNTSRYRGVGIIGQVLSESADYSTIMMPQKAAKVHPAAQPAKARSETPVTIPGPSKNLAQIQQDKQGGARLTVSARLGYDGFLLSAALAPA